MKTQKQITVCLTVGLVIACALDANAVPMPEVSRGLPVTVINPISKPIPVTEVKQYLIQNQVSSKFTGVNWVTVNKIYTVPADKRLIIEYFSCRSSSGSYSTSYSCFIVTGKYGEDVTHLLPSTPYGHDRIYGIDSSTQKNPQAFMSAGQRVQLFAQPGTEVDVGAFRQNSKIPTVFDYDIDEWMIFSFSGYLVDIAN